MPSLAEQAQTIADMYQPPITGRPSDVGDAYTVKELLEAIEAGNYLETACHLAGLSHVTVLNWRKRGDAGERPFDAFVTALKQAEARAEAKMVANVRKASELPQFWAAAATHLERRHPERWGKRQDDSSQPKVVVNIGVGSGDVRVGIALSPSVSEDLHRLSASDDSVQRPISGHYVNEVEATRESVPAITPTPIGDPLRPDRAGDPTPVGGGVGVPSQEAQVKGPVRRRSFLGRARRKKGQAGG